MPEGSGGSFNTSTVPLGHAARLHRDTDFHFGQAVWYHLGDLSKVVFDAASLLYILCQATKPANKSKVEREKLPPWASYKQLAPVFPAQAPSLKRKLLSHFMCSPFWIDST